MPNIRDAVVVDADVADDATVVTVVVVGVVVTAAVVVVVVVVVVGKQSPPSKKHSGKFNASSHTPFPQSEGVIVPVRMASQAL